MSESGRYAEQLRVLGQVIEAYAANDFDVEVDGEEYVVRSPGSPPKPTGSLLDRLFSRLQDRDSAAGSASGEMLQVARLSQDNIARWETAGQAARRDQSAVPDAYGLSQKLRAVGEYLESMDAEPRRISKTGTNVVVEYATAGGQAVTELSLPQLYDLFIRMYRRRSKNRANRDEPQPDKL